MAALRGRYGMPFRAGKSGAEAPHSSNLYAALKSRSSTEISIGVSRLSSEEDVKLAEIGAKAIEM